MEKCYFWSVGCGQDDPTYPRRPDGAERDIVVVKDLWCSSDTVLEQMTTSSVAIAQYNKENKKNKYIVFLSIEKYFVCFLEIDKIQSGRKNSRYMVTRMCFDLLCYLTWSGILQEKCRKKATITLSPW